jgi:GxxExxY protein
VKELRLRGLRAEAQAPMEVSHKGENVGTYLANIVVEDELVLELKCANRLGAEHTAPYVNYLRASGRRRARAEIVVISRKIIFPNTLFSIT